jgi:hypothetical protein
MSRKTATIERRHLYGTPRYQLYVTYCGHTLRWNEGMTSCYAIVQDDPTGAPAGMPADVRIARDHAKRFGFTHVRIAGDWERRTKPRGGAL